MPRKPDRQPQKQSPLFAKQQELDREAAQIKAKLNQTEEFLKKAPDLKSAAQQRQQKAAFDRHSRPNSIEGPPDYRMEFANNKPLSPPKRLRKDRSKEALVTFFLLMVFSVVIYYAWRVLLQN